MATRNRPPRFGLASRPSVAASVASLPRGPSAPPSAIAAPAPRVLRRSVPRVIPDNPSSTREPALWSVTSPSFPCSRTLDQRRKHSPSTTTQPSSPARPRLPHPRATRPKKPGGCPHIRHVLLLL